jgi:hypothetical protein
MLVGLATSLVYAQVSSPLNEDQEGNAGETPTKMTKELSCEIIPESGLLCGNSELGLCVLRTDMSAVNGSDRWNIMSPILCEA